MRKLGRGPLAALVIALAVDAPPARVLREQAALVAAVAPALYVGAVLLFLVPLLLLGRAKRARAGEQPVRREPAARPADPVQP
jgi:hypothetical protein